MYSLLSMVGFHRLMMPPLHTHRLDLQPLALTDLHTIKAIVHKPQFIQASHGCQIPNSVNQLLHWIIEQQKQHQRGKGCCYVIREQMKNELIGIVTLQPKAQRIELSYWLCPSYWRRGLMTEALLCILHQWHSTHPQTKIYACCHADNVASLALLKKVGMKSDKNADVDAVKQLIWQDEE